MKVQFELTIGENKFTLIEDVDSHTDFFKKLNFYSTLPKTGPNGETDLVLRHRIATTKAGKKVDYFSIVSEKAKQEFKFGQSQQVKDALFPKGWEPLFQKDGAVDDESEEKAQSASVPSVGLGGLGAPPAARMPTPAPSVGLGGAPKAAAPVAAAPTPAPAALVSPQVQNKAANILAKFGI